MTRLLNVRWMIYVIWAWCLAIIAWAVRAGASTSGRTANCVTQMAGYLSRHDCANATSAGAGVAMLVILLVGVFGFVFLSMIWFMSRTKPVVAS